MSEDEVNSPEPEGGGDEAAAGTARKRAAKKRATKKQATKKRAAKKTVAPEAAEGAAEAVTGGQPEASDDAGRAAGDRDGADGGEPRAGGDGRSADQRGGDRQSRHPHPKARHGQHPQQQHPQQQRKNRKKKKGRWQNKKPRSREEERPLELGDLPEWEALEAFDRIAELADSIADGRGEPLDFNRVYNLGLPELREEASAAGMEMSQAPGRDQLINAIVAGAAENRARIETTGVLEPLEDDEGGLLVYERDNYRVRPLSAFVPQAFIERYGLERGHLVKAMLHPRRGEATCPFVVAVDSVMGRDPGTVAGIVPFTEHVPYYPLDRILLETDAESGSDNLSMRVVDCLTPLGFGQRGLLVAPPRTGKTVLLQGMAKSIQTNYPEAHLIVLLIDERPEEVTDFKRQVRGEVISSTFDESAESHVHAAEMVIEKARRMVETGGDVIILLDSITRLARAYNTTMPNSGKILSGGVEANALQKPKRFFGSARNIEEGGSLTIVATALVETGSKMDEVIFEEFKGTGNMELHLDRGLSDKRIYPALDMEKSGTRKEELLYHPDEMQKIYSLRRAMKGVPSTEAMEMLIQRIKKTKTNAEFLMSVAR